MAEHAINSRKSLQALIPRIDESCFETRSSSTSGNSATIYLSLSFARKERVGRAGRLKGDSGPFGTLHSRISRVFHGYLAGPYFAQVSRSVMVRLNTGRPAVVSLESRQK